jgi:hypothetical protein
MANENESLPLNGQEIFRIDENVQIYFIGKDDEVSAPTSPTFLRVVVVNPGKIQQLTVNE